MLQTQLFHDSLDPEPSLLQAEILSGEGAHGASVLACFRPVPALSAQDWRRFREALNALPEEVAGVDHGFWRTVLRLLRDPIRTWETRGGRLVVVLDAFGYCLQWNRMRRVRAASLQPNVAFASEVESVVYAFRTSTDMARVVDTLIDTHGRAANGVLGPSVTEVTHSADIAIKLLRSRGVLRALNRALRVALAVNERALRLAATARTSFRAGIASNEAYRLAAQQGNTLATIRTETPNLLPLVVHAYLAGVISSVHRGTVGEVRAALSKEAVPPRVWRLLARSPVNAVRHALRVQRDQQPWDGLIAYCRHLAEWRVSRHVPADLLRAIFSSQEPDRWNRVAFSIRGPTDAQFIQLGIEEYWRRSPDQRARFVASELLLVLNWVWDDMPYLDRNQRRAGWPRVIRTARIWADGQAVKARHSAHTWPIPCPALTQDGLTAIGLGSPYEIWKEAQALRHCAMSYVSACIDQEAIVYSIRSTTGVRVATVAFERADGFASWKLLCVRGFANSVVPNSVERFAGWLTVAVNARDRRRRACTKRAHSGLPTTSEAEVGR